MNDNLAWSQSNYDSLCVLLASVQKLRQLKTRFGVRFWETVIEHTYERFGPTFDLLSRPLWSAYPIDWLNSVIGDAIRVNGFRNVTEYKRSRDVETTPSYAEYHRLFLDRGMRPGESIFAQLVNVSGRERADDEPVLISEG